MSIESATSSPTSPSFCVLPWLHRFTNIGGEVQVCCISEEYDNSNRDQNGTPLFVDKCADDQILMNTQFMKDLRLQMLKGEWPQLCRRCQDRENGGGHSARQQENKVYASQIPELLANTAEDGEIPAKIRSVDFRLGNTCNLACRMCSPRSSSKWAREWKSVKPNWFPVSEQDLKIFRSYDWYRSPEIWQAFKTQLPHLTHLHFAGGEPMIVPEMVKALRICVEAGQAANITLSYNTNLTEIPEEAKDLWPNFKAVRIVASIDGVGDLNDYIRYPSKWSAIDKNLHDLNTNFQKYRLHSVALLVTVQAYNVLSLSEIYKYMARGFNNLIPHPNLMNLYNPVHLRTQVLPPALKKLATERLAGVKQKLTSSLDRYPNWRLRPHYLDSIDSVIHFMNAEDRQDLLPKFFQTAISIDQQRGQNLFTRVPELQEVYNQVKTSPSALDLF